MTAPPGNRYTPAQKLQGVHATMPSGQHGGYLLGRLSSGQGPVEILSIPWLMRMASKFLKGVGICGGIPYFVNNTTEASTAELQQDALVLGGGCAPPDGGGWNTPGGGGMTFANNNKTALATTAGFTSVLSTSVGGRFTGKWYAVMSVDQLDGTIGFGTPAPRPAIGVGNASMSLAAVPGFDANGASFYGAYFFNNPEFHGAGSASDTQFIFGIATTVAPVLATLAVDLDNNWIYLKWHDTDLWSPRDPNTGAGFDIASVNDGVEVFLAFGGLKANGAGSQITLETASLDTDSRITAFSRWAGADTGQPPYTNSHWTIPNGTAVLTGDSTASEVIGDPTGGDEGAGTINVSGGYYVNGVSVGGALIGTIYRVNSVGDIYITG